MPLAFTSVSHGTVAFGFFNIETECLLLDRVFFFGTDFCRAVGDLAKTTDAGGGRGESGLPGYVFARPEEIGDLMGAIHGTRRVGFLGEVYALWPFPASPEGFRQKLHGARNRARVEALLRRQSTSERIALVAECDRGLVSVGEYVFTREGFLELLAYVWRGGYPTWEATEERRRPSWVEGLAPAAEVLGGRSMQHDAATE